MPLSNTAASATLKFWVAAPEADEIPQRFVTRYRSH